MRGYMKEAVVLLCYSSNVLLVTVHRVLSDFTFQGHI